MKLVKMIKKNTKIIFEGVDIQKNELIGGVPLSVGEIVNLHLEDGKSVKCMVVDKKIDITFCGEDQIADITYTLRRKK